jgi:hypothetical protein
VRGIGHRRRRPRRDGVPVVGSASDRARWSRWLTLSSPRWSTTSTTPCDLGPIRSVARRCALIQVCRVRCGQRSEQIADAMTAVTASGWEISVRCDPPWNMVMCECARWAIASSEAAVMI